MKTPKYSFFQLKCLRDTEDGFEWLNWNLYAWFRVLCNIMSRWLSAFITNGRAHILYNDFVKTNSIWNYWQIEWEVRSFVIVAYFSLLIFPFSGMDILNFHRTQTTSLYAFIKWNICWRTDFPNISRGFFFLLNSCRLFTFW